MKKIILAVTIITLMAAPCLAGLIAPGINVDFELSGKQMDGHTTYRLTADEWLPWYGTIYRIKSELEYPLDVNMGGGALKFSGNIAEKLPWALTVEYYKSLQDPGKFMKDSDWIEVPSYDIYEFVQFTESDLTLDAKTYDVSLSIGVINRPVIKVFGKLGYLNQKFSFDVSSIRGWYLDTAEVRQHYEDYIDQQVLYYSVEYKMPYIGVDFEIYPIKLIDLNLQFAISPKTKGIDFDDHILRFKSSVADCSGTTLMGEGLARLNLSVIPGPVNWDIGFGFEYLQFTLEGEQTQTWYGDDPASPGYDDTGNVSSGIDYEMESKQTAFKIVLSGSF